jgi:hypothetical protein
MAVSTRRRSRELLVGGREKTDTVAPSEDGVANRQMLRGLRGVADVWRRNCPERGHHQEGSRSGAAEISCSAADHGKGGIAMLSALRSLLSSASAPIPTREIQQRLGLVADEQRREFVAALGALQAQGEIRYQPQGWIAGGSS